MTTNTHTSATLRAPCPLHAIDPIQTELTRRRFERDAKLAALLKNSPPDEHALLRWEHDHPHPDTDLDLLDTGLHDLCPACGASLPPGYLTTPVTTSADTIH